MILKGRNCLPAFTGQRESRQAGQTRFEGVQSVAGFVLECRGVEARRRGRRLPHVPTWAPGDHNAGSVTPQGPRAALAVLARGWAPAPVATHQAFAVACIPIYLSP